MNGVASQTRNGVSENPAMVQSARCGISKMPTDCPLLHAEASTARASAGLKWCIELNSVRKPSRRSGTARAGRLSESGLGDTQAELRWRWAHESLSRPEIFSYFESDF